MDKFSAKRKSMTQSYSVCIRYIFARYKDGKARGIVCLENWNGTGSIEKVQVNGTGEPPLAWHEEEEEEDKKIEAHWRALFSYLQVGGEDLFRWPG